VRMRSSVHAARRQASMENFVSTTERDLHEEFEHWVFENKAPLLV